MFEEPVTLSFILKTVAVIIAITAIGIVYVNKNKRGK